VESFFGTLKNEMVDRCRLATREVARQEVFEYIEVWSQSAASSLVAGLCQPRRVRAPGVDRFERRALTGPESLSSARA
jgi:hypothetical protein